MLERIDEAGTVTKLDYDPAGRIESRSILVTDENGEVHETDKENYAYDPSGRLAGTQNAHSRHQYFYDKLGNLIREYRHDSLDGTARSHVWHHRYDALGNRTETIRPDGQRIGYLHYGSGHLHGITLNHNEIAAFERDKLHRETERTFGKHIRQQTQYDPMGRILQQIHNRSRREYGYDAAGQLTHIQSKGGQTQYRYDPIGRLIAAVTPDFSETFAFDPADNRLDLSGNKQDHTGQANSQEKPSLNKVWGNLLKEYAGVHYDYDQRGNLIRKTRNGETTDYHWNGYNQLIKIENRNGSTEYRYDPLGRRTAKIRNGETTVYHWQEDTLAIESTNGQNTHYLFEPGTFEPLAQFQTTSPIGIEREDKPADPYGYDPETDPLLKIPPEPQEQSEVRPELVYYQLDHLGTPIAAHNAKGEAVWTAEYEAWGRICKETVSDGLKTNIPFRFQGQYYDEESGLHYNRFRYYDPEIGRFVSQDPIGLDGGLNIYVYVKNPVQWVDPSGLDSQWVRNWKDRYGELAADHQVHHIIPKNKTTVSLAKSLCANFQEHSASNLIALPESASVSAKSGNGYGKTLHYAGHGAYTKAVNQALRVAQRIKIPGMTACQKLAVVQDALREQLEKGGITLYGTSHSNGPPGVRIDWQAVIRKHVRGK